MPILPAFVHRDLRCFESGGIRFIEIKSTDGRMVRLSVDICRQIADVLAEYDRRLEESLHPWIPGLDAGGGR